jgi:hypothetical protein
VDKRVNLTKRSGWEVLIIDRKRAILFIEKNHSISGLPAVCWCFGLFDAAKRLRGVAAFSSPTSPTIYKLFDGFCDRSEVGQLSKLVLQANSRFNSGSYLLGRAVKMYLNIKENIQIIITYCASDSEKKGTVYSASNWEMFGETKIRRNAIAREKSGNEIHCRSLSRLLKKNENLKIVNFVPRKKMYRYIYVRRNSRIIKLNLEKKFTKNSA